jgi:hypothetical protein
MVDHSKARIGAIVGRVVFGDDESRELRDRAQDRALAEQRTRFAVSLGSSIFTTRGVLTGPAPITPEDVEGLGRLSELVSRGAVQAISEAEVRARTPPSDWRYRAVRALCLGSVGIVPGGTALTVEQLGGSENAARLVARGLVVAREPPQGPPEQGSGPEAA